MNRNEYERIAEYIRDSELPRREAKLDGLRRAEIKRIPLRLVWMADERTLLVDGIAADWSELENGYWL